MTNFQLKPKYYFGVGALNNLSKEINQTKYKKVLILYGGGSIKKNGVYDSIVDQLANLKISYVEFGGIEPNPRDTTIYKAAQFCDTNKVDLILATGGGSVIDASKVIATLANNLYIKETWDYVTSKETAKNLPIDIFSIITLAGTGSENNAGSVITNQKLTRKAGVFSPLAIPKVVFEDATYTLTLSDWQMSSGMFDCFSHLLEQYYDNKIFMWSEQIIIANMKTLLKSMDIYLKDPKNITARENILWTTSMSLNGMTAFNSTGGDWNVHILEHALTAKYDITHGAGLALLTPYYIEYRCKYEDWFKQKTVALARELFKVDSVEVFLKYLNEIVDKLNLPRAYLDFPQIKEINGDEDFQWLANHASESCKNLPNKTYFEILKSVRIK